MTNRVSFFTLSLVLSLTVSLSQAQTTYIDSLRQRAEQGDTDAQFNLGGLYRYGEGVPQDHTESAKWYRKAAEQGDAGAQYFLGVLCHLGRGVPQDYVQAYMWYNLAASKLKRDHRKEAISGLRPTSGRNRVAKKMTREEISEAQRLVREWAEKHRP